MVPPTAGSAAQQWEGVILGLEVNYNHMSLATGDSDSVSVRIANDATAPAGHHFIYDPFTVSGTASIRITDLATLRARGLGSGKFPALCLCRARGGARRCDPV